MPDTNYQQSNDTGGTPLDPPPPYREAAPDYSHHPADSHQFNGETFGSQGKSASTERPPAFNPNAPQPDFGFTFHQFQISTTNVQTTTTTTTTTTNHISTKRKLFAGGIGLLIL